MFFCMRDIIISIRESQLLQNHKKKHIISPKRTRVPNRKTKRQKEKKERSRDLLKNSYESQQSALLGICVKTLGVNPLANPLIPSLLQIILNASTIPLAPLISPSPDVPLVCKSVFATSNGVVNPAATAPAKPPETICDEGEYSFPGFSTFFRYSYTVNCAAVKGTVIVSVVG